LPGYAIELQAKREGKRNDGGYQDPACDQAGREPLPGSGFAPNELSVWIAEHHLKQAEAAEIVMVSRPRVCDVVNRKTAKFTIDTPVEMPGRMGRPVKLAIG
jgi:hypothetical protein